MKQRYLEVGRTMRDYEGRKYEQWKEATEQTLPTLMKKSLLTKVQLPSLPQVRPCRTGWQLCHFLQARPACLCELVGKRMCKK